MSISYNTISIVERLLIGLPFANSDEFKLFLPMLCQTFAVNDSGIIYDILGTRCSGDAHTSVANGLINHFNTWLALRKLPVDSWTSYHEGDDGVIALRSDVVDQAVFNLHIIPTLGYDLKMIVSRSLSAVTFCGRFLYTELDQVKSYCDPFRTLNKIHTINAEGDNQALLLAKMMSYYYTDRSTPVIGSLCYSVIAILKPVVNHRRLERAFKRICDNYWAREKLRLCSKLDHYPYVEPDSNIRAAFAFRTGMDIYSQTAFEKYYISWIRLGYIPAQVYRIPSDWDMKPNITLWFNDYLL